MHPSSPFPVEQAPQLSFTFPSFDAIVILTTEQIDSIARLLGARIERVGSDTLLHIGGVSPNTPKVVMTISALTDDSTVLSAQTVHGYFELHGVTRFVPVDPDEVIFVTEDGSRMSGLVVGSTGACSLFAHVDRSNLSADFTTLEPTLLLAAMQLGLAENFAA